MIRFEIRGGLLYVPISIRHCEQQSTLNSIVDTGSAGSAVDTNCLRPNFERDARFAEIVGVGGRQPALIQSVDRIAIGDLCLEDFPIEFADLENSFGVQAILGNDILVRYGALINYQANTLSFLCSQNG